jgi:hypothetical protein
VAGGSSRLQSKQQQQQLQQQQQQRQQQQQAASRAAAGCKQGGSRTYEGEVLGGRKARQRQLGVEVPKEGWLLLAGPSRLLLGRMGKLGRQLGRMLRCPCQVAANLPLSQYNISAGCRQATGAAGCKQASSSRLQVNDSSRLRGSSSRLQASSSWLQASSMLQARQHQRDICGSAYLTRAA